MVTIKELNHILTTHGISQQHIEKMKERQFEAVDFYNNFFDKKCKKGIQKVSLSKLKGLESGWDIEGRSVYDCFTSIASDSPLNSNSERIVKYTRIIENIDSLKKNGLEFQYNFYESDSEKGLRAGLPNFIHFYNSELGIDCYFSDATHRSICALMFGAPFLTGYVTEYELSTKKYENYQLVEKKLVDLGEKNFGLFSLKFSTQCLSDFKIYYKGYNTNIGGNIPLPVFYVEKEVLAFKQSIDTLNDILNLLDNKVQSSLTLKLLHKISDENSYIAKLVAVIFRKLFKYSNQYNKPVGLYLCIEDVFNIFETTDEMLRTLKNEFIHSIVNKQTK
ncbi:MAG: hypothetical protein KH258_00240 [Streptococcus salivarius]|nr:hypothetical protein [Streptococcus salivarius]